MRIIVAGASGFIGARLCSFLADEGFEIIALCNKNVPQDKRWQNKMSEVVQIDLSSEEELTRLERFEAEVIINLVSLDHIESNGSPAVISKVNVLPTWNFLHHFSKKGLKKFIYLSTIHVYGNQLDGLITENDPLAPVSPYGLTHLLSEEVINMFSRTTDVIYYNIRFSNGYGVPQFMWNKCWDLVINNLCLSVWNTQKLILKSDGTPLRDFINISDLLVGIKQIITDKTAQGDNKVSTINFSMKDTISMLDAAMLIKEVYEKKYNKLATVCINESQPVLSYQKVKTEKYGIDNSAFLKLMGNNHLHDIAFGVNEIFDYLDQQTEL